MAMVCERGKNKLAIAVFKEATLRGKGAQEKGRPPGTHGVKVMEQIVQGKSCESIGVRAPRYNTAGRMS